MTRSGTRFCAWVVVSTALTLTAAEASAGTIYFGSGNVGGRAVAGTADVTFGTDEVTIVLTNTTGTTYNAGQLLTGLRFGFTNVSGVGSLTSATAADSRDIFSDGSYSDGGSAV